MASKSKWALITGVSEGGLGDALTQELLKHEVNVIATGLKLEHLDYLSTSGTAKLVHLELDVSSPTSIASAVESVQKITGDGLDILVNNAGYGYMTPLLDADIDRVKKNFDINVFGLLAVTQALFPLLRAAKGMVVNQASIAGLPNVSQPFIGSYSASKTAVIDLSNTLRLELAPFGVKVVTLVTGDVKTHFWKAAQTHQPEILESSPYLPIKSRVEDMMSGRSNPKGQHDAGRWARAVVVDLLQPSPPVHIRRGYLATTIRYVSWLFPVWLFDWLFTQSSELGKLRKMVEEEESKKNR